jgi:branched-chain amino acid transport system substrate-binding protein
MMAQILAATLEQTGGVIAGEAFIEAASGITLEDSLYGPISFDEYHNIVGPVYLEHTGDRGDGTYWNVVDETFPDVSQFWTYDPAEFLANPVFSREYTGQ